MITGNYYNKYKSENIFVQFLMNMFRRNLYNLLELVNFESILDVGSGEGYLLEFIIAKYPQKKISAIEIDTRLVSEIKMHLPSVMVTQGSVYNLSFKDNYFDIVLACEVLEHLNDPHVALSEIKRVSNKYVLLTVPHEPMWSILNFLRGKYLTSLGNTPGHVQRWNKKSFCSFVSNYLNIVEYKRVGMWQMLLAEI